MSTSDEQEEDFYQLPRWSIKLSYVAMGISLHLCLILGISGYYLLKKQAASALPKGCTNGGGMYIKTTLSYEQSIPKSMIGLYKNPSELLTSKGSPIPAASAMKDYKQAESMSYTSNCGYPSGRGSLARKAPPTKSQTRAKRISTSEFPWLEKSVQSGLGWLARHQNADGSWSSKDAPLNCGGDKESCELANKNPGYQSKDDFTIALTGFAILAFTKAGYSHRSENSVDYSECLKKAMKWLQSKQVKSKDPKLRGLYSSQPVETLRLNQQNDLPDAILYNHAVATTAMADLLSLADDEVDIGDRNERKIALANSAKQRKAFRFCAHIERVKMCAYDQSRFTREKLSPLNYWLRRAMQSYRSCHDLKLVRPVSRTEFKYIQNFICKTKIYNKSKLNGSIAQDMLINFQKCDARRDWSREARSDWNNKILKKYTSSQCTASNCNNGYLSGETAREFEMGGAYTTALGVILLVRCCR